VLLDNGRSKILGSEYVESLYCIRCGACLNICPVYGEIGGHAYGATYPGPIGAVLTPLLDGLNNQTKWLPYASSLCGACQEVCPVRIPLPDYLLKLRRDAVRQIGASVSERAAMRGWRLAMSSTKLYRTSGKAARLGTRLLGRRGRIRRLPPPFDAWTHGRDFPQFAQGSFKERWARTRDKGREAGDE
jgi:L-lactate dehydrogenase complex protein LldF